MINVDDLKSYLEVDKKKLIFGLLKVSIKNNVYDSRSRCALINMCFDLRMEKEFIEEELIFEDEIKKNMDKPEKIVNEERLQREKQNRTKKLIWTGVGASLGGLVLGLTGGLTAPIIVPLVGTILGTTIFAGTVGLATVTSIFGLAGAGLTGYKVARRIGSVNEFEFLPLLSNQERHLHVVISISGWLTEDDDVTEPWKSLESKYEVYCLKYETSILKKLGSSLKNILAQEALGYAATEFLKTTFFASLMVAFVWPASILKVASVIDNPWSMAMERSIKAGIILADVLEGRVHGDRPVTLIGFSMGAVVIESCLESLWQRLAPEKDLLGIINNIVLLGSPITLDVPKWNNFRNLVAGRIINGYVKSDWILSFVHRAFSAGVTIMGLHDVSDKLPFIENINLSENVSGHLDYKKKIESIISMLPKDPLYL